MMTKIFIENKELARFGLARYRALGFYSKNPDLFIHSPVYSKHIYVYGHTCLIVTICQRLPPTDTGKLTVEFTNLMLELPGSGYMIKFHLFTAV